MADVIVRVLEQMKLVTHGCEHDRGLIVLKKDDDDEIDLELDWTAWLGGDTIDQVNLDVGHTDVTAVLATPLVTLTVGSGFGLASIRITTATSAETKEIGLYVKPIDPSASVIRDYC